MCGVPKNNQAVDANGKRIKNSYQAANGSVITSDKTNPMAAFYAYQADRKAKNLRQDLQPAKGTGAATLARGGAAQLPSNSLLGG